MTATNGLDLNLVSAFVRVVEDGSFTGAARHLGLPKSSVSRRVTALEQALRVRLLQRSTRKLVLTEAGRLYFERARASLGGLADAGAAVTDLSGEVAGPIRFTTGGDNTGLFANLFAEFLTRYPKVQIDVVLTPRRVDLVAEGFDSALRAGPLVDSTLIARRLGRGELGLFASRAYLRKAGHPRRIADLAEHRSSSSARRTSARTCASPGPAARRRSRSGGRSSPTRWGSPPTRSRPASASGCSRTSTWGGSRRVVCGPAGGIWCACCPTTASSGPS